jgi:hypothetical protein
VVLELGVQQLIAQDPAFSVDTDTIAFDVYRQPGRCNGILSIVHPFNEEGEHSRRGGSHSIPYASSLSCWPKIVVDALYGGGAKQHGSLAMSEVILGESDRAVKIVSIGTQAFCRIDSHQ